MRAAAQQSFDPALPSVEDAYKSIPHKRTVFQKDVAKMPRSEADLLTEYFTLIDQGIVLKVSSTRRISNGQNIQSELARYDRLLTELSVLEKKFPKPFVTLTKQAVQEQKEFFQNWTNDLSSKRFPAASRSLTDRLSDPLIGSASGKLIQAYQKVLESYPQETTRIKEAFFDYHCALDFL